MNLRVRFDRVFALEVRIAAAVFALVLLVVIFAVLRSRTRFGQKASQTSSHPKAESVYVSIVAAVAVFLVYWSLSSNADPPARNPTLTVDVTGFQWCWRFAYEGTPVVVTADCIDGRIPTMVLPIGRTIRFNVTSTDVIHNMWIPHLDFKLAAYPDHVDTFTTRLSTDGTWAARCAEFCGLYHYAMDFDLQAVEPARFDTWLHDQGSTRP